MTISAIFKSRIPSCSYFFRSGLQAAFIGGKFVTAIAEQIQELADEVRKNHPHIYVDPEEFQVDSEALSPLEVIKKEALEQARAEVAAAMAADRDGGTSDNGPAGASFANTATISEGAAGSDGDSATLTPAATLGAKLANLTSSLTK